MANPKLMLSSLITLFLAAVPQNLEATSSDSIQRTYIIFVENPENSNFTTIEARDKWYSSFLPNATDSFTRERILRTYTPTINAFVANLNQVELNHVQNKADFLFAAQNRDRHLFTTHNPAFLGLHRHSGFWNYSRFGAGVVIGLIDTGILPSHPSFSIDDDMPDPPSAWSGLCEFHDNVTVSCNKKLIGARSLNIPCKTGPNDNDGHGTHAAATAAGAFVNGASVLGSAAGTAAGLAPRAHIAMYKVCEGGSCLDDAILAGIDAAINDGVDVLSISLGFDPEPFYGDVIAVAAFKAVKKGIFVSCAAGNGGPYNSSVTNAAPWILTVGASNVDRQIRATVKLGNGVELHGQSAYQPKAASTALPLLFPNSSNGIKEADNCLVFTQQPVDVRGKAVVCILDRGWVTVGRILKDAGAAALIIVNGKADGYTTMAQAHALPVSHISYEDGLKMLSYVNSTSNPTAFIDFRGTITGVTPAPTVSSFSSRGPSRASPGIMKPDIIGPGVSVLAAWPYPVGPEHNQSADAMTFNLLSGTSVAAPHLSGIAALLKSAHPDWTPAAIKSAIMTTADTIANDAGPIKNEQHEPADYYAMGAGHVNPSKAAEPGLVYDLNADDYIPYLCGLGYTNTQVRYITGARVSCCTVKNMTEAELNYPSIVFRVGTHDTVNVSRVVTNVGEPRSSYRAVVDMPKGVRVSVEPETLQFSKLGEKKGFVVSVEIEDTSSGIKKAEGSLNWVSEKHLVRSPVLVLSG